MNIRMNKSAIGGLSNGSSKRFGAGRIYVAPKDLPEETALGFVDIGAAVVVKARAWAPENKARGAVAQNRTFQAGGPEAVAGANGGNPGKRPVLTTGRPGNRAGGAG